MIGVRRLLPACIGLAVLALVLSTETAAQVARSFFLMDSSGNALASATTTPGGSDRALVVREAGTPTNVAVGDIAHDSADSGNPVKVGGKAANALPTAVANAERTNLITDLFGRLMVTSIDPAQQLWKQVEATTTQTGTAIWTPASGKRVAVTSEEITTGGTTACVATIWLSTSGDTTFTQGTDQVVFRGEFAPSSTARPGAVQTFSTPRFAVTADHVLKYTTSAGCTIYITVYGYEF